MWTPSCDFTLQPGIWAGFVKNRLILNHRLTGWKRPQDIFSSSSCLKEAQLWSQTRSLRALNESLKPPWMETAWPPWEACYLTWMSWHWKSFFFYLALTSLVPVCACCLWSSRFTFLWRPCLHLLDNLLQSCPFSRLNIQPLLTGQVLQCQPPRCSSVELTNFSIKAAMLKEASDVAAPLSQQLPNKYCSQDNLPDLLSAWDSAIMLAKGVDTNKQSTPQGAQLHTAYAATNISHFCDPQATQAPSWDAVSPKHHLLPTP